MVEETDTGWWTVFEKQGLHQVTHMYDHPEIRPQIEVMKTEVMKYQALADCIKSFEERKDIKGKDNFDLSDWWKSNCATLTSIHIRAGKYRVETGGSVEESCTVCGVVYCSPTHPTL